MLTSIRLQDFKGHRDSTVPLGRFTVLVGPNGSGKTSVLQALRIQSGLVDHSEQQVLVGDWSFGDLLRRGAQGSIVLTTEGTLDATHYCSRIELASSSIKFELHHDSVRRGYLHGRGLSLSGAVDNISQFIKPAALYKLDAVKIAAASYSDKPGQGVAEDGTNAAVALTAIKLGYDEDFLRIEEMLRKIIPNVERVRIHQAIVRRPNPALRTHDEEVVGSKIAFDFRGAPGVPAHAASEGTLITLALLTILYGPTRPGMLLLDDLADALHPQAQMDLVRLIRRLLDEIPDLQIVATTHSPYILDELDPAEVIAFALRDDGTVALKPLSEHPQAAAMKGSLSAGQIWSLDPERAWVLAEKVP